MSDLSPWAITCCLAYLFMPSCPADNAAGIGHPTAILSAREDDARIVEELDKFLAGLDERGEVYGAVLLARGEEVLFLKSYGLASARYGVPNKPDTKFNLGSMNKMFTAVTIAQLVEQGKLSFDDPISKYLGTDWVRKELGDKVTIHHLLSHTSGLGSYFTQEFFDTSRLKFKALDDYKPVLSDETAFEPGARFLYSNSGMFLLGVVIEKVTGTNYFDYTREHLFRVCGMSNTACYEMDEEVPNLATGLIRDEQGRWLNNFFLHSIKGGPAGGGFSTVEDLHKFAATMLADKLIKRETRDILWTVKVPGGSYAYGFVVNGEIVGHSGGFPGISSNLDIFTDSGYVAAVMLNYGNMQPVMRKIRELLGER